MRHTTESDPNVGLMCGHTGRAEKVGPRRIRFSWYEGNGGRVALEGSPPLHDKAMGHTTRGGAVSPCCRDEAP